MVDFWIAALDVGETIQSIDEWLIRKWTGFLIFSAMDQIGHPEKDASKSKKRKGMPIYLLIVYYSEAVAKVLINASMRILPSPSRSYSASLPLLAKPSFVPILALSSISRYYRVGKLIPFIV